MFSKLFYSLLFAILVQSVGCTDFLRGTPKTDEVVEPKELEPSCMKSFPQFLSDYISDISSDQQIDDNMTCFQNSLRTFMRYTRGENPSQYKDSEIQYFLNRYLLNENKITDELMHEFMRLKTVIVGGSEKFYTRDELEQFLFFTNTIKAELKNMKGTVRFLLFKLEDQDKGESIKNHLTNLDAIHKQVVKSFMNIISQTKILNSFYELSYLKSLSEHMDSFINSKGMLRSALNNFDLIIAFKNLFLGEHTKLQSLSEWKEYVEWAVQAYFMSLTYHYDLRHFQKNSTNDWNRLLLFTDQALSLIESAPNLKSKGFLPAVNIDQLIDQVWNFDYFSKFINKEIFKNTYRRALAHLVDGKVSSVNELYEHENFSMKHLSVLKFEYQVWRQTQLFNISLFSKNKKINLKELQDKFKIYPQDLYSRFPLKPYDWNEWQQILFKSPRPVALTDDLKFDMRLETSQLEHSLETLSQMNLVKSWVRFTMRGYGDQSKNGYLNSSMSEDSLIRLEKDFREFALAIGFLDRRVQDAPKRAFKEGNYFTFSGNGDDRLDGFETFELLNIFLTGGGVTLKQLDVILDKQQCRTNEKDVMGKFKAKQVCAKKALKEHASLLFNNLPGFQAFISKSSDQDYDDFYKTLYSLSKNPNESKDELDFSELRAMTTLIQYVESLLISYDKDLSGTLNQSEIAAAVPRFNAIIMGFIPVEVLKKEFIVRQAFLYLVFEGKVPTPAELLGSFVHNNWHNREVSRLNLFKVVDVLKNYAN